MTSNLNTAGGRRTRRGSQGWRVVTVLSLLPTCACSLTAGAVASHLQNPDSVQSVGVRTGVMGDISLLRTRANVAFGTDMTLLERVGEGSSDNFGQARWTLRLGLTKMPAPHEFPLGCEFLLAPALSRHYVDGVTTLGASFGVDAGLPIRLSPSRPRWRADHLFADGLYLVPSFEWAVLLPASQGGAVDYDASVGLTFRYRVWSAMFL